MSRLIVAVLATTAISVALACSDASEQTHVQVETELVSERDETSVASPSEDCVRETFGAARALGKALKTRLVAAMADGVGVAVDACASDAHTIREQVVRSTGVRVGRASTKLRNPGNEGAPTWVHEYLSAHARDDAPPSLREQVDGEARVILPLIANAVCVTCHGTNIATDVRAKIEERYPADRATGYEEGDLRGVIWATQQCGN